MQNKAAFPPPSFAGVATGFFSHQECGFPPTTSHKDGAFSLSSQPECGPTATWPSLGTGRVGATYRVLGHRESCGESRPGEVTWRDGHLRPYQGCRARSCQGRRGRTYLGPKAGNRGPAASGELPGQAGGGAGAEGGAGPAGEAGP